jgi:signal-transduction protein with cAMP-binding, CBS, and nucleotidyltransferase domain
MQLRLKYQAIALLENEPPQNIIEYNSLSHIEQNTLKRSHKEISALQQELSIEFKRMA